jgi:subtilase family serine protease
MLSTRQFAIIFSLRIILLICSRFFTNHNPPFPFYSSLNGSIGENGGIYNRIGRGYPDISANGVNGSIIYGEAPWLESGTSMSTPLVAAIFTRINDERLAAGKSPIGFVNPTLYANPQMFNDITVGDQSLCPCGANFFSCVEGSSYSHITMLFPLEEWEAGGSFRSYWLAQLPKQLIGSLGSHPKTTFLLF